MAFVWLFGALATGLYALDTLTTVLRVTFSRATLARSRMFMNALFFGAMGSASVAFIMATIRSWQPI